jgi:hypothetical protein
MFVTVAHGRAGPSQPPIPSGLRQPDGGGCEGAGGGIRGGCEAVRMQHGRFDGPPDDDDGRGFIGFD